MWLVGVVIRRYIDILIIIIYSNLVCTQKSPTHLYITMMSLRAFTCICIRVHMRLRAFASTKDGPIHLSKNI